MSSLFSCFPATRPFLSQKKAESSLKDSSKQHQVDLKTDDLPASIPKVMDTLQGIGHYVGQEISKAASKAFRVSGSLRDENIWLP
jgi:hypothetical protein